MNLYEQARTRVENSPSLNEWADMILADWPEGDSHWEWVMSSSEEEIINWARYAEPESANCDSYETQAAWERMMAHWTEMENEYWYNSM